MDLYNWYPMECAPTGCPVEIIEGTFVLEDGSIVQLLTKSYTANGWGARGSSFLVGEELKPLPHFLLITWLSFFDGIIYEGIIELPSEFIANTFKEGFISPIDGRQKTYQYILVGMAPEGTLCIWLHQDGISKEVGFFKCKPNKATTYTSLLSDVINRGEYINQHLALYFKDVHEARTTYNNSDKTVWEYLYRKPCALLLDIVTLGTPLNIIIHYYSGESENFVFEKEVGDKILTFIPKEFILTWISTSEQSKLFSFAFKEGEVFEAARKIKEIQEDGPVVLQVLLSENSLNCSVLIKDSNHFVVLNNNH